MKVKDLMVRDVIFTNADDTAGSAMAKMVSKGVSQLVVRDRDSISGIIELKNIVTKDIDISKTKVGTLCRSVTFLRPDDDITEAAKSIISNGARALPVMEGGRITGIISETDVIKEAGNFIDVNSEIGQIKSKPIYASKNDNIGKIRHMMSWSNISRIPIVERGKVVGVVSTLDLAKASEAKTGFDARAKTKNRGFKEKIRIEEIMAGTIMGRASTVKMNEKIKNVVKILQNNEQVIIEDGGVGIVTPKDIMELFLSKPAKQVYVQVTGMPDDIELQGFIDSTTTKFVQKMGKSFRDIQGLFVHVEIHQKQGNKSKYSIRTRFITEDGIFVSHSSGWSPSDVVQDAFENLEKETRSHLGKKHEGTLKIKREKKKS